LLLFKNITIQTLKVKLNSGGSQDGYTLIGKIKNVKVGFSHFCLSNKIFYFDLGKKTKI